MNKAVLDSQTLGEIVSLLREAGRNGRGRELRKAARLQVQSRILIARWRDGKPVEAQTAITRDLSATGIGVMTGTNFVNGDDLVLLLPKMHKAYEAIVGKVIFAAESATSIFTIGAEFTEILTPTATQDVLKFFLGSSVIPKAATAAAEAAVQAATAATPAAPASASAPAPAAPPAPTPVAAKEKPAPSKENPAPAAPALTAK